jgi:hypothetical protein
MYKDKKLMIAITDAVYDDFHNQYSSMPYLAARSRILSSMMSILSWSPRFLVVSKNT